MSTEMKHWHPGQLLSTGEVAAVFNVSRDTVIRWIKAGRIDALRTPTGSFRVPVSAILPYLEQVSRERMFKVSVPTATDHERRTSCQRCGGPYDEDVNAWGCCDPCLEVELGGRR